MKTIAKTALVDSSQRVLLLKRSLTDDARPGDWDFPGGGVDEGEDILQAAAREILEETGISVAWQALTLVYTRTEYSEQFDESQNCLLFVTKIEMPEVKLSSEHTAYDWLDVGDVLRLWQHPFWSTGLRYALDNNLLPN